jgi:hypothetical protein
VRREYATKGQRIQITDDFRASSRRSIRVGKLHNIDSAYREKLKVMRGACEKKAEQLLADVRRSKGATR